jgi:hypothetical protein
MEDYHPVWMIIVQNILLIISGKDNWKTEDIFEKFICRR